MQGDERQLLTPSWVTAAAGESIAAAHPARWGFRHETWIVEAPGGRSRVVQRRVDGSDPTSQRARAVRDLVRASGLPIPEPVQAPSAESEIVVTLPLVEGVVAAELLGTAADAAVVGRLCGEIGARIGGIDPTGVAWSGAWASSDRIRVWSEARLASQGSALSGETRRRLRGTVDRAADELDTLGTALVHGDLVPVNVLIRDGRLAALLDLDRVQLAHPHYDLAWFAWVVRFFHPDVADAACDAFGRAAGLAARPVGRLAWMWPLQLFERLAEARNPQERAAWTDRLSALGSG